MFSLENNDLERIVKEVLIGIPKDLLNKLENVEVVIEDFPNISQVQKLRQRGEKGILLGFYEGRPLTKRGNYTGALPDKITLFKRNIFAIAGSKEEVKRIVKNTVLHEIAHHFGMGEEQVQAAERSRIK